VALAADAVRLETASGEEASPAALAALGSAYARDGRFAQAAPLLLDAWGRRDSGVWTRDLSLQIAGMLGLTLLQLGRDDDLDRLLRQAVPRADAVHDQWGAAAVPVLTMLRIVEGRHSYVRGDVDRARDLLTRSVTYAEADGRPTMLVLALTFLADAELACGTRAAARAALAGARDVVDDGEPVVPFVVSLLQHAEQRIGRDAVRSANRAGALVEPLTDRELSILRMLTGVASQREIGAALFLSINTVKAYTKSLYRKLGVASRHDAVATARELGLI
jgi:LuxR family maltose regulon positive regulatory protein